MPRFIGLLLPLLLLSCSRPPAAPSTRPVVRPAIASLVPSATDLLVGMGAGDHLVAISNYDIQRPETAGLPKVGDYQSVDWERLATIRPDVMITFQAPDRLPAGMRQKAESLHIRLVNFRADTLEEMYGEMTHLGEVAGEPGKAAEALASLRKQLEEVRRNASSYPKVRTLIVSDQSATGAVGRHTFLSEILEIAGGENVLTSSGWLNIDREQMLALHPDAVIQLLAGASPQVEAEARSLWGKFPELPAVREGRVTIINQWYTLQPGSHLPDLARRFAEALHPSPSSTRPGSAPRPPASQPSPGRG